MKKMSYVLLLAIISFVFVVFHQQKIMASDVVAYNSQEDIFGELVNYIGINSDGKIELRYKYGLRKADVYYCLKGEGCDSGYYQSANIMESDTYNTYKNTDSELDVYWYKIPFKQTGVEYRVRVEAYFGTTSAYTGVEQIGGSFTISSVQIADTDDKYILASSNNVKDPRVRDLLDDIQIITNTVALPIIYIITTMFLVIKGAILGVQIIKSADNSSIRSEKIGALKWLVIGVAIAYAATTLVGIVSGFFKETLGLNL